MAQGTKKLPKKKSKPAERQVRKGAPRKAKLRSEAGKHHKEVEKAIRQKIEKEIRTKAGDDRLQSNDSK